MTSTPFNAPACLAFVSRFGPVTVREISFALQVDQRRIRDHLLLHRDLYASKKDEATGVRIWSMIKDRSAPNE